ncbi:hypothetical protein CDAR_114101 [Caerostris darwini]|uniref:Secreted protein n=1 Tax=Caerostris darwini TaxID=1538125 RepID=A0AAV4MH99_9ARAC|nr:hypothetical protein CDAR_114101 [Caerostris darwini]
MRTNYGSEYKLLFYALLIFVYPLQNSYQSCTRYDIQTEYRNQQRNITSAKKCSSENVIINNPLMMKGKRNVVCFPDQVLESFQTYSKPSKKSNPVFRCF